MPEAQPHDSSARIDLYWRPGCGFCAMLQRKVKKLGIEVQEHNIWDNPADAAVVRRYANGNETVPTIVVDGVGLVNPSSKHLVGYLAEHHPELLPEEGETETSGTVGRLVSRVFGG